MSYLNTPWKVEESPGEILVVDKKNLIVAALDLESAPGKIEDEKAKAYLFAAAPVIHEKAQLLIFALADENLCQNEDELLRRVNSLEAALKLAEIPDFIPAPPETIKKPVVAEKPKTLRAAGR